MNNVPTYGAPIRTTQERILRTEIVGFLRGDGSTILATSDPYYVEQVDFN